MVNSHCFIVPNNIVNTTYNWQQFNLLLGNSKNIVITKIFQLLDLKRFRDECKNIAKCLFLYLNNVQVTVTS